MHFFWGSFDLAVTRFSGRRAPLHPGGVPHLPDAVVREAYSHEVSSAGFWPGGGAIEYAAFYSYAYPDAGGLCRGAGCAGRSLLQQRTGRIHPARTMPCAHAADPNRVLLAFLQSTYAAAADLGAWDRAALECALGRLGDAAGGSLERSLDLHDIPIVIARFMRATPICFAIKWVTRIARASRRATG